MPCVDVLGAGAGVVSALDVGALGVGALGACGDGAAPLAGAGAFAAAVVSIAAGGADLGANSRGVKTMTSAIKAAASRVRLSMQSSEKSSRQSIH